MKWYPFWKGISMFQTKEFFCNIIIFWKENFHIDIIILWFAVRIDLTIWWFEQDAQKFNFLVFSTASESREPSDSTWIFSFSIAVLYFKESTLILVLEEHSVSKGMFVIKFIPFPLTKWYQSDPFFEEVSYLGREFDNILGSHFLRRVKNRIRKRKEDKR